MEDQQPQGGTLTSRQVGAAKVAPPQVSAGLTVLKRDVETDPVDPFVARLVSKSRAQKFLRKVFNEARFQTVDTPAELSGIGLETWQLWCKGSYGKLVAVVEVTAPRELLPYSVCREALKRLDQQLEVTPATMRAFKLPPKPDETIQHTP